MWLTDASPDALDVARANLAGIGRNGANVRIAAGRWFDALPVGTRLDLVVSNPPYIAAGSPLVDDSVRSWEPHEALFAGRTGSTTSGPSSRRRRAGFDPAAGSSSRSGPTRDAAVADLLSGAGFAEVGIRPDLAARDRVAVARLTD